MFFNLSKSKWISKHRLSILMLIRTHHMAILQNRLVQIVVGIGCTHIGLYLSFTQVLLGVGVSILYSISNWLFILSHMKWSYLLLWRWTLIKVQLPNGVSHPWWILIRILTTLWPQLNMLCASISRAVCRQCWFLSTCTSCRKQLGSSFCQFVWCYAHVIWVITLNELSACCLEELVQPWNMRWQGLSWNILWWETKLLLVWWRHEWLK